MNRIDTRFAALAAEGRAAFVAYLMAGSDILIMRHPEAVRLVKSYVDLAYGGGSAAKVAPIKKRLDDVDIDLAKLAPKPDLKIEEEKNSVQPFIMGRDLIELGIAAGPEMGKFLKYLFEQQIENGWETKEEAMKFLKIEII